MPAAAVSPPLPLAHPRRAQHLPRPRGTPEEPTTTATSCFERIHAPAAPLRDPIRRHGKPRHPPGGDVERKWGPRRQRRRRQPRPSRQPWRPRWHLRSAQAQSLQPGSSGSSADEASPAGEGVRRTSLSAREPPSHPRHRHRRPYRRCRPHRLHPRRDWTFPPWARSGAGRARPRGEPGPVTGGTGSTAAWRGESGEGGSAGVGRGRATRGSAPLHRRPFHLRGRGGAGGG